MWQHKDFIRLVITLCTISIISVLIGMFISPLTAIVIVMTTGTMLTVTIIHTGKRYREIKQLSVFLRKISQGDYTLDVRDNYEGELSILKSEIYKVTTMLADQRNLLQADKTQLTNAISDISHQIKTPLTSMSMMADLLQSDNLPAEKRETFTQTIRKQLERMEWLVSALLKLSKIDAGTAKFQQEQIYVKDLIDNALETVLIPLDIKDQKVIIHGDPETVVQADMNWTSEALTNILSNAISHTPEAGALQINFSRNAFFTEISLQDNGPGIPKEDLPYIFKRFYRGKNASEDSVGIGLAMAYSIVKEQAGNIEVTSSPETGTTFTLKFYH